MVPDLPHEDTQSSTSAPVRFRLLAISAIIPTLIGGCGEPKVPDQPVVLHVGRLRGAARPLPIVETRPRIVGNAGSHERPNDANQNFSMAFDLLVLVKTNQNGQHNRLIDRLVSFLEAAQWNASSGVDRSDAYYGGSGPGGSSPPDLFHTAIAIEALHEAGVPANDPYMQRALVFISRCQNLKSRFNQLPGSGESNDGGFAGVPMKRNQSTGKGLKHHSCGSMTCMALKALVDAGVSKDDARIQAALNWLHRHYTLKGNPGKVDPEDGLYLYYYTFAKAMRALDIDSFIDHRGTKHDWRSELAETLIHRQQPNGSWVSSTKNLNSFHSDTHTFFAVLTLCQLRDAQTPSSDLSRH